MNTLIHQIRAVAITEWRLAWRGPGFRLVLLLVALPFAALILPTHRIPPWDDDGGVGNITYATSFVALTAAFLIVPTYHREQMTRVVEIMWVRPLSSVAYLIGKILGGVLMGGALLVEMAALVALYQVTGAGSVGEPLLTGTLLVTAPALLLFTALYVACGAIFRYPVVGYLVALVTCGLFGFFLTQSMVSLWNPWAQSLAYHRVLGFGTDLPLLLANRLFYGGITLMLAGSTLVLFAWRERRALAPRWQQPVALVVLALGAADTGLAAPRFEAAVAAVTPSSPVVAPQAAGLAVQAYRLDVRLDPATGTVQGVARFTIHNDAAAPVTMLPLYLNDGLRVRSATVDGHAVAVRSAALFSYLALAPALAPSAHASVRVVYTGQYKLVRPEYGSDRPGLLGPSADTMIPPLHQGYVGAGLAVLFRDGDWYPLPWTQATTTIRPVPLGWQALHVWLPANATPLASTPHVQRHGREQVLTWVLSGRLPTAVLAVVPGGYVRVLVPGGAIYAPGADPSALRAQYGPYVAALHDLALFFGHPDRSVTVVAVPPHWGAGVVGVRAAVGDNLAIVPLSSLDQTPEGADIGVAHLAPPAPYRAALSDLAVAWWADRLPTRSSPTISNPGIALPTGYISVAETDTQSGDDPTHMLAGYTGAAVAAQHDGRALYHREMDGRRAAIALTRQNAIQQQLLRAGQGRLGPTLRALGLAGRLTDIDATPALDDLRQQIGAERLRQVLMDLAATGQTPDDASSVACALSRATGRPVAAWMNYYLGAPVADTGAACR